MYQYEISWSWQFHCGNVRRILLFRRNALNYLGGVGLYANYLSWIVQKNVIYVDKYFYVSVWIHVDVYGREIANSKANRVKAKCESM